MANGKTTTGKWTHKGQDLPDMTEDEARMYIEKLLWPDGQPVCPHCGSVNAYKMQGDTCRPGLCRCRDCKKQFTVTVGTIFEDSHIPLAKWVKAVHLMCSSKKGISALQLQRNLALGSYRSAWFMAHRIRLAMKCEPLRGALAGNVEVDETYVGGKPRKMAKGTPADAPKPKRGRGTKKTPVVVLVERGGACKSMPVERVDAKTLRAALQESVHPSAVVMTDELAPYRIATVGYAKHCRVNHSEGEYVRGETHINTAESFFSLLKRGVYGVFHHISKKHMHRYCDEFDFRWGVRPLKDAQRREIAIQQARGKRLMYAAPVGQPA
jgi:transposase-like protein